MSVFRFSILLLVSFYGFNISAKAFNEALKFGKIPDELIKMTVYEADPEAEAVVLSHVGEAKIDFIQAKGFLIYYKYHKVIKVLNKEGVSQADIQIPYYNFPNRTDAVFNIKGFVYNYENGKIVKEKIGKEHIFEESVSKSFKIKKISFPNVKEGSVIELSYEINSDLYSYLREWEFQTDIPTKWSEYSLEYPEYFSFSQSNQGYVKYFINEQSAGNGTANWTDKERIDNGRTTTSSYSANSVSYSTMKYHWAVKDSPALRSEPFIDNPMSYVTKVEFQLQYIQFPGSQRQNIAVSWEKLSEELLNDEDFGKHLNRNRFAKEIVEDLIADAGTEKEKIQAIANHLGKKVSWDGKLGIYPTKSLDKVYKEGKGTVADLNFLLTVFLREAGINAHPIVNSTRGKGFLNPSNPVMYRLNYVCVLAQWEDKEMILDATEASLPVGFLPIRAINFRGWAVIPDGGSKWVEIQNIEPNFEKALIATRFQEGEILTEVQKAMQGYKSAYIKNEFVSNGEEKYRESFANGLKDWKLLSLTLENTDSREKGIVEKYTIQGTGGMTSSGDFIYYSPFEDSPLSENPFKLDKRIFPIDFIYPLKRQLVFQIDAPDGFVVDEVPQSMIVHFKDKSLLYSFQSQVLGDSKIQVMINYQINESLFTYEDYQDIRVFFDNVAQKQKESIVFRKN